MRKLTSVISKTNCVAIFINQIREKIGVMYGNPETTPGGRALKFYASVRIDVRKGEAIKGTDGILGNRTRCKIVKNKVSPPFKECEFDLLFGQGISRTGEVLDIAVELGIVKKSGAWYSYKESKIGQGREAAKEFLKNQPETMKEIEELVKSNADALAQVSKKNKKEAAIQAAAAAAAAEEENRSGASEGKAAAESVDVLAGVDIDTDDDFEEFTPV